MEHTLDEISVGPGEVADVISCLLHTILTTRLPRGVVPTDVSCPSLPAISYPMYADTEKINRAIKSFESDASASGVVVAFYKSKISYMWFGLVSIEEKIYHERWIIPIRVVVPPPSCTEFALSDAVSKILTTIEPTPDGHEIEILVR